MGQQVRNSKEKFNPKKDDLETCVEMLEYWFKANSIEDKKSHLITCLDADT